MKGTLQAIGERCSTRSYTAEPLDRGTIETLVRAGLQAPTAANRQEIHITVVDGQDPILAEIGREMYAGREMPAQAPSFYYGAPVVLLLSGDGSFPWTPVDAGIAAENIALAAEGMGLGSLIIGCIRGAMTGPAGDRFASELGFPAGYVFQVAVALGHQAAGKAPHTYDMERNVTWR